MRGKASVRSGTVRAGRITPAYAGKSTARRRAYLFFWDHPRICGEKPLEEHGGAVITGSPPHMRGKDIRGVVQNVLFGITPAYAGKRCSDRWLQTVPGDHPRICGEKRLQSTLRGTQNGSPPHMRGKAVLKKCEVREIGITPAYAGKSWMLWRCWRLRRDHPRICGEKFLMSVAHPFRLGSPPHMRGKAMLSPRGARFVGITPAYAGKSGTVAGAVRGRGDHPRICGEKLSLQNSTRPLSGSPPHMRGKAQKGSI